MAAETRVSAEAPEKKKLPQHLALLEEIFEALNKPLVGSELLVREAREMAKRLNEYWQPVFVRHEDILNTEKVRLEDGYEISLGQEVTRGDFYISGKHPKDETDNFWITLAPDLNNSLSPPIFQNMHTSFVGVKSPSSFGYFSVVVENGRTFSIERSENVKGTSKVGKIRIEGLTQA